MAFPLPVLESPRVFMTSDGTWERSGYCNRCGSCCAGCELLATQADGLPGCDRVNATYLAGCNEWPTKPRHTAPHPECSYRWREVKPGGR